MSKYDTNFFKILTLLFCLVLIQWTSSGCIRGGKEKSTYQFGSDQNSDHDSTQTSGILSGTKVFETDLLAKKVFYLAINSQLLKTPQGFAASQESFCSAIAITPWIAMTAAHCVENILPQKVNLIEGVTPWLSPLKSELWHQAKHILIHPEYKKNQPESDLALLYLSTPLTQDSLIRFYELDPHESIVVLAGYGFRINSKSQSVQSEFQQRNDLLKNISGELFYLKKTLKDYDLNQLTFSFEKSITEAVCIGDSGGPALIFDQDSQTFSVIGLLSGSADSIKTHAMTNFENDDFCSESPVYINLRHPEIRGWIERSINQLTNQLLDSN